MVHRRQPPSKMIRLLIRRRHRDAKPNILRRGGHRRNNRQGLIHRPLGAGNGRRVKRALVDVVAAEDVSNKYAVELGLLKQFGELNPVIDISEAPGLVVGVTPEAGRLVAAAWGSVSNSR